MRRKLFVLVVLLPVFAGCGSEPDRIYDFKGQVVSVEEGGKGVTIDHEDIPGLMRAMKMRFAVQDPALMEGLVPGMSVEGKLKVVAGKYLLTELKRKGGPIGEEREIQEALSKLRPEDRRYAEQQGYCPISDKALGTMGLPIKLNIKGERVFLCCESCRKKAEENPDTTLKALAEIRDK